MGQLKIKQRNTDEIIKPGSHVFPLLRRRRRAVEAMSLLSFTAPSTPYSLPCNTFQNYSKKVVSFSAPNAQLSVCCSCHNPQGNGEQTKSSLHSIGRRILFVYLAGTCMSPVLPSLGKTKTQNPYDEKRLLEQNKRIQRENNAPDEFPSFVREGFSVKVVTSDNYVTRDSGLVLWDVVVGEGAYPKEGQQITFHYVGYNESGRRIDSTYLQGSPAKVRLGTNALVPGFEEGIKDMKPGGKRRIIVPPELGPPVGPSTFFSAKQFEVFDVELLSIQDCTRRTIVGFYSDVVCN